MVDKAPVDSELLKKVQDVVDFVVEAIYDVDDYLGEIERGLKEEPIHPGGITRGVLYIKEKVNASYENVSKPAASKLKGGTEKMLKEWGYKPWELIYSRLEEYSRLLERYVNEGNWDRVEEVRETMANTIMNSLWDLHNSLLVSFYTVAAGRG